MKRNRPKRKRKKAPLAFWIHAVLWGLGILFGLFGAFVGSLRLPRGPLVLGLVGLGGGFLAGFLLKAIEGLPPRWGRFFDRTRWRGGAPIFDIKLFLTGRKDDRF